VSFVVVLTSAKRLELLSELVPTAEMMGMLVNPNNPNAESTTRDAHTAAEKLGKNLVVVRAGKERDLKQIPVKVVHNLHAESTPHIGLLGGS
jgi:putative ABC transport system substrate-binding protein